MCVCACVCVRGYKRKEEREGKRDRSRYKELSFLGSIENNLFPFLNHLKVVSD